MLQKKYFDCLFLIVVFFCVFCADLACNNIISILGIPTSATATSSVRRYFFRDANTNANVHM